MSSEDTTLDHLLKTIRRQGDLEREAADGLVPPEWVRSAFNAGLDRAIDCVLEWANGRVVVDLPEPDDGAIVWHPGNPFDYGASVVAYADRMGPWVDAVQREGEVHTRPAVARKIAASLLAAANEAERLSVPGEVRNGQ